MSVRIMARVWETGPTNQAERFVLLALADFANDAGECWPSIKAICGKVCMSERGVQTVIRRLEAGGWLAIETGNGRHGCNKYTIETPQEMHPANPAGNAPRRKCTPHMDAETPHMDARNPAPGAPEPSRTIKNHQVCIDAPEVVLAHHADDSAVASFIAYRKRHKSKALTATGAKRLAKHLAEINARGGDASDALAMAEERGWASVEPDWYFNAKGKSHGQSDDPTLRAIARAAGAF